MNLGPGNLVPIWSVRKLKEHVSQSLAQNLYLFNQIQLLIELKPYTPS